MNLPFKLAILVIVIFGLLVTGMVLWRPVKIRHYMGKLRSDDIKTQQAAAKILLDLDAMEPVFKYYTGRYSSKDVKERMKVVDELCECSDKGKALMKKIFKNWCYSPSQQVKTPTGELTLKNGSKVKIKSLYVDKYEVMHEKYWVYLVLSHKYGEAVKRLAENNDLIDKPLYPLTYVSWNDMKAYTNWLGMRLPNQYEWEYAALADSTGKYCFGDNDSILGEYAWFKDNSGGEPHPVGKKKPNKWGLYDVQGNVWEKTIPFRNEILRLPYNIIRGGSCRNDKNDCGITNDSYDIQLNTRYVGYRCVRDAGEN